MNNTHCTIDLVNWDIISKVMDIDDERGLIEYSSSDTTNEKATNHYKLIQPNKHDLHNSANTLEVELKAAMKIRSIYPNPTTTTVSFDFEESKVLHSLAIHNANGDMIMSYSDFKNSDYTVDISTLNKELYFIKLEYLN